MLLALTGIQDLKAALPLIVRAPRAFTAGTNLVWTLEAQTTTNRSLQYKLSITGADGSLKVLRAYSTKGVFDWTPTEEGDYILTATVQDSSTGETSSAQTQFHVTSPLNPDGSPVLTPAKNPLVAIYSTTCTAGNMRVLFWPSSAPPSDAQATPSKACQPGVSLNFVIAGMRAATQYVVRNEVVNGTQTRQSSDLMFQTPALPKNLFWAAVSSSVPSPGLTSKERVVLESFAGPEPTIVAYDNSGNVVWYCSDPDFTGAWMFRPVAQENTLLMSSFGYGEVLREVDFIGNVLREVTAADVSSQLRQMGFPSLTGGFHHDAIRLPDGSTAALASFDRFAEQGGVRTNVNGDVIVVLDRNWRVSWVWNSFDKLDVNRKAILGELTGWPAATLTPWANDWLHANSLAYTSDKNLLLSMRDQDWIIKIDYRDGAGTGDVIWRLGNQGDFSTTSSEPFPWFSHQHDAALNGDLLTVFDNGNTRINVLGGGHSRGQVWKIDEQSRKADLILSSDLGTYSFIVGSAQPLWNGNLQFLSGAVLMSTGFRAVSTEIVPDPKPIGTDNFVFSVGRLTYRTFRLLDLYH